MTKTKRKTPKWLKICATYTATLMVLLFVFIITYATIGLYQSGNALISSKWNPETNQYGILPMICGTLLLSSSALLMGATISLGCISYLHGIGTKKIATLLRATLRLMTAIPTVVYGFASVFMLVPIVRNALGGSGYSWLTATIILGILIVPTMVLSIDEAITEQEKETTLTATALGLTPQQTLINITLPASKKWITSSLLLGFGRATGDTLIPAMLAGNAVQYPKLPTDAIRTLTVHIGLVLSSDIGGPAYYSLFVAGGLLLLISITTNILIRKTKEEKN
ncbi:MAG: ABC transporter permease subunit [Synergistaceae bacterium]